jgi:hypothetical protein
VSLRTLHRFGLLIPLALATGAQTCPRGGGREVFQVRGVVVEQATGRAVSDADVSIPGTEQRAITNAAGQFALCYVPAGTYDVSAEVPGFPAAMAHVTVPAAADTSRVRLSIPGSGAAGRTSTREARPLLIGDTAALVVDGTRRAYGVYDGCDLQGPNAEGWHTLKLTPDVVSSVEVLHGPEARAQYGFPHVLAVTTRRFQNP